MDIPACQEAFFWGGSANIKMESGDGKLVLANSIILLFISSIKNATAKHFKISSTELYVNLCMVSYSLHIYMQESQRPGAGMCGCLCTVKWQTFFTCLQTLSLPTLSPNFKPPNSLAPRLALHQTFTHNSTLLQQHLLNLNVQTNHLKSC